VRDGKALKNPWWKGEGVDDPLEFLSFTASLKMQIKSTRAKLDAEVRGIFDFDWICPMIIS
jgi:hypothetical protein